MFLEINGSQMYYNDRGDSKAPAILFIHGFPLDRRIWDAQLVGLSGDMRVIVPDLRGHGRSLVTPGPLTMEQHADDMAKLLERLEISQATIAGLSMGGYVSLALWRRHNACVDRLVLADTRAEPDSEAALAARQTAIEKVRKHGAAAYVAEMLPRMLGTASLGRSELVARVRRIMGSQRAEGIIGALEGLRDRSDSRPTLPSIDVPTLVLVGDEDTLTPPSDSKAMAEAIPGARLEMIPRSGHLTSMENPRAFNAALRSFLGI